MNKIPKIYINMGHCHLFMTIWQGQLLPVTLVLCWPCVSLCVRVPCENGWWQAEEQQTGSHGALDRGKFCCHFVLVLAFCFNCRCFPSIFTCSILWEVKPGVVAHASKSTSGKLSQEIQSLRSAWSIQQELDSKTVKGLPTKCIWDTHFLPLSQLPKGLK